VNEYVGQEIISRHQIMHTLVEEKLNSLQVARPTPCIDNKCSDKS